MGARAPPYAIKQHPILKVGKDTYQEFARKLFSGYINIIGNRISESIQRREAFARGSVETTGKAYPIWDWKNDDVWLYLKKNDLKIPDAYLYMWQCGVKKNALRISQFFSIDTVAGLLRMCQFYPGLFDKICGREPNAYMAMLYLDSEMFRRKKKEAEDDSTDYKQKVFDIINDRKKYKVALSDDVFRSYVRTIKIKAIFFSQKNWKNLYQALIAGDPKKRTIRAVLQDAFSRAEK